MRRIYSDEDVVRFARKLYPMGVFGFECTVDKVIAELKNYNDFSIHRVKILVLKWLLFLSFNIYLCWIFIKVIENN